MPEPAGRIVSGDHELTYVVSAESWYARRGRVDLVVSARSPGGGVAWEFAVLDRADIGCPSIQLSIFTDALTVFGEIPDFFAALATENPTDLPTVRSILDRIGAVDGTTRNRPADALLPRPADEVLFSWMRR